MSTVRSRSGGGPDAGFSVVEVMMALLIMAIIMASLTYVLVNSLTDVAYSRQRSTALSLANQTIEEVRALPWAMIQQGMSPSADSTWSGDGSNLSGNCFQRLPLDVNGTTGAACAAPVTWSDPTCPSVASGLPTTATLTSPAPLRPHLACYKVNGITYGVAAYLTGTANQAVVGAPVTAIVAVWWNHAARRGLSDHVVTSTQLSDCLLVGSSC